MRDPGNEVGSEYISVALLSCVADMSNTFRRLVLKHGMPERRNAGTPEY